MEEIQESNFKIKMLNKMLNKSILKYELYTIISEKYVKKRHKTVKTREKNSQKSPLKVEFRVFYSEHTLADFEKKCPILRVNALVRKKVVSSPLRLLPTARNARELSERTNRISIKHNSRKIP